MKPIINELFTSVITDLYDILYTRMARNDNGLSCYLIVSYNKETYSMYKYCTSLSPNLNSIMETLTNREIRNEI